MRDVAVTGVQTCVFRSARDHFGIKPFFYSSIGPLLVVSNMIDCIRRHPAVSRRLNDLAIADFLLFDMIREPGATSFADIQRLPPAHVLSCEADRKSTRLNSSHGYISY